METGSREKPALDPTLLKGYAELLAPAAFSSLGDSDFLGFLFTGSPLLSFSRWPSSGATAFSLLSPLREFIIWFRRLSLPYFKTLCSAGERRLAAAEVE